jgi:UDP-3-O-[3-hydroxymyristoyl] glucosamine N-acyltransferase
MPRRFHGRKDQLVTVTVQQLADLIRGTVVGDGKLPIRYARTLHSAEAGDITFLEQDKNLPQLEQSRASAAIVTRNLSPNGKTVIQVGDPLMAFAVVFQHLQNKAKVFPSGISPRADLHPSVLVGEDASIQAFACIGEGTSIGKRCQIHHGVVLGKNCRVGDDVCLFPNVVVYDDVVIGDRVVIHAGAIIGADGFGFRFHQGRHVKVPQLSYAIIGDDVEIGANTCIDRGAFEPTRIGDGTKIDNHVQIAHNCQIGKHNLLAAQVGIGGSSSTGNHVVMGGQVGISDHVQIGEGAMFGAKTGVLNNIPAGQRSFWYPALDMREAAKIIACLKRLPTIRRDVQRLLQELDLPAEDGKPAHGPEASAA